jgi:cell wall-associated NlpC family hydrolase
LVAAVSAFALALGALAAPSAQAASAPSYVGHIATAFQYRDGSVWVVGYAYDRRHPSRTAQVCLAVNGRCVKRLNADLPSPRFDRPRHITGGHRFQARLGSRRPGYRIALRSASGLLDAANADSPGDRITRIAKKYVGARYTDGGASPRTGFDCSGYTLYAYRQADVASLPHNAQSQRYVRYMHRITRSQARPGDLVFYLSGSSAYHVAIYAGHGWQYAAATPRDGVRYQAIWSRDVVFGTDWH